VKAHDHERVREGWERVWRKPHLGIELRLWFSMTRAWRGRRSTMAAELEGGGYGGWRC